MELSVFKKSIIESPNYDFFKEMTVDFKFPFLNETKTIKGIYNIYKYVFEEVEGWKAIKNEVPRELSNSITYFQSVKESIINSVAQINQQKNLETSSFNYYTNEIKEKIRNTNSYKPLPHNLPLTNFLIALNTQNNELFNGAYKYFSDNISSGNLTRNTMSGILLAYEFENTHGSDFVKRKELEKKSLISLKNNFVKLTEKSEEELLEHLKNYNEKYYEKLEEIQKFKNEKENLFSDWFKTSSNDYESFFSQSKAKILDLEKTYEEKLRLEKPAEYWRLRAEKLNKQGSFYFNTMIVIIGLFGIALYILLLVAPQGMLISFEQPSSAIKWSIISILFVSLVFYGIRLAQKIAFSTFHLARDAEEREQLTYVYLSLLKENTVDVEEKKLVLQALFSRAETGLLKEDSSPTMPNDLIGKVLNR